MNLERIISKLKKCRARLAILATIQLLCGNSVILAYSLSGYVSDRKTSASLAAAKITIINLDTGLRDSILTASDGSWIFQVPSGLKPEIILPSAFRVFQNYPNPFNPATLIGFNIPTAGEVSVEIFNLRGEKVCSRRDWLTAGYHQIRWISQGSAGVYFYRIRYGSQQISNKMVQLDGGTAGGLSDFVTEPPPGQLILNRLHPDRYELICSRFAYHPDTTIVEVMDDLRLDFQLQTIHEFATVVDLHNDILEKMLVDTSYHLKSLHTKNHTDIPRLQTGGVDVQFFSVWAEPVESNPTYYTNALRMLTIFQNECRANPATLQQAFNYSELISINSIGKIAGVIGVEGGHHIENDLTKLVQLYTLGMRYMTITWNNSTSWAVSAADEANGKPGGLTDFGRQVIRTLDSLGVVIDVSHVGIQTIHDILAVTNHPIIASHSGARSLYNHYRNLWDTEIRAIAASGGVIGIVFYPPFLKGNSATINDVVNHINYIVNLVGIEHVALGSDFDGIGKVVQGLEDTSKFPALTNALLTAGYNEAEVLKILGGNFLRVFQQICGTPGI